jgi:hypothetical protein
MRERRVGFLEPRSRSHPHVCVAQKRLSWLLSGVSMVGSFSAGPNNQRGIAVTHDNPHPVQQASSAWRLVLVNKSEDCSRLEMPALCHATNPCHTSTNQTRLVAALVFNLFSTRGTCMRPVILFPFVDPSHGTLGLDSPGQCFSFLSSSSVDREQHPSCRMQVQNVGGSTRAVLISQAPSLTLMNQAAILL